MKTLRFSTWLLALAATGLLAPTQSTQAATRLLPFQGRLSDAQGAAVPDGARVVQFKIYDAPLGGQAVWNGEVQKLTVNAGLVSTILGTKAALSGVDFNRDLYLELTIDANGDDQISLSDPPLLPRQSIFAAVFAFEAASAQEAANSAKLAGRDWSALLISGNDPLSGKISGSKIDPARNFTAEHFATNIGMWMKGGPDTVYHDGQVGIGTTTPDAKLHVAGGNIHVAGGDIEAGAPGEEWLFHTRSAFGGDFLHITDRDNGLLNFEGGLVVHENGNVGIATTAPSARLHVQGSAIIEGNLHVSGGTVLAGSTQIQGPLLAPSIGINMFLNGWGLYLGSVGEFNHFLTHGNSLGNQSGFDGPILAGIGGGVLGTSTDWCLRWNADGTVRTRGTLTGGSDRNQKEHFTAVDATQVLSKVLALPITRWNFKAAPKAEHIGPMAQDFHAAFGLGSDDVSIAMVDADGVALAAIQGLNQKVEEKDARIAELERRLEKLERLVNRENGRAR